MAKRAEIEGFDAASIIDDARNIRDNPPEPDKALIMHSEQSDTTDLQIQEQQEVIEISKEPVPISNKQELKEPSRRKRALPSYKEVFVKRNEIKHRQCVYVSYEAHSLISSLVRMLVEGGDEVTVGGYIDRIITEHLQAYKDDINELYRNRRPDLLK